MSFGVRRKREFETQAPAERPLKTRKFGWLGDLLTVDDHRLDHEIFVVVRGNDATVVAGQLDGRVDDMERTVHGQVVVGRAVVEVDAVSENADADGSVARYPLIHGTFAVVEVPSDDQSDGIRKQRVHAVQDHSRPDACHDGRGHSEFIERHVAYSNKMTIN